MVSEECSKWHVLLNQRFAIVKCHTALQSFISNHDSSKYYVVCSSSNSLWYMLQSRLNSSSLKAVNDCC